jgi:hypothetical protein
MNMVLVVACAYAVMAAIFVELVERAPYEADR